jgi:hypothetical protein
MVKRTDYTKSAVTAAKSVLVELAHLLGEYRKDIVLIGGWVPELLIQGAEEPHVGSMDIDLALNHLTLGEAGYATIGKLLLDRGYIEGEQPFIYFREFMVEGRQYRVQVDLLAGEYEGTGKGHRTQRIQDIKARKARGCDLAFRMSENVKVEGKLPDGALDSAEIKVASIVPFLVMKGMALHDRLKEKDAWDVYYCLRNYPKGLDGIKEEISKQVDNVLVKEGLAKIADKFASTEHMGPQSVADFEEVTDEESREYLIRDAYERVQYLLEGLGVNNE